MIKCSQNLLLQFFICLVPILFVFCKKDKRPEEMIVFLETKNENNPFGNSLKPFKFFDSGNVPKNIRGVVNRDSSFIGFLNTISPKNLKQVKKVDSLIASANRIVESRVYCSSGYNNGKQYYMVDTNGDNDFSDEIIVEFDNNLTFETGRSFNLRDSFPSTKVLMKKFDQGVSFMDEEVIKIYPDANYFSYSSPLNDTEQLRNKLQLVAMFDSYYYGVFLIENKAYKVAINKNGLFEGDITFADYTEIFHNRNDYGFEKYRISDTVKFASSYYRLDSLSHHPPTLKLKPLMVQKKYGFRRGDVSKEYQITDLNGNTKNLKSFFEDDKKFLLIDFWGTWCNPCKALTPDLVDLNKKFGDKISLLSIAFQNEIEPVIKYVSDNEMDWQHGMVKGNPKSVNPKAKIINDLRIESFPTFIILDKNLEIVFRGHGGTFKEMLAYIDKTAI